MELIMVPIRGGAWYIGFERSIVSEDIKINTRCFVVNASLDSRQIYASMEKESEIERERVENLQQQAIVEA